jgi:uncharacterized repeat protein (TIGR01451 family)
MTAPHPSVKSMLGLFSTSVAMVLLFAGSWGWAGEGLSCVPPPLVAPTPEPPLVNELPPPRPQPVLGTAAPADPPPPVVVLHVRVPAEAAAGQELEYRICVENCSSAPAHHVLVRNPLPAHARFVRANPEPAVREPELLWRLGTLEAGAKRQIILILAPSGDGDITSCARVQFEHGECATTRVARPKLSMQKSGPAQAVLAETLNYRLTFTNTGDADLANLLVTDVLPPGLEHASGKDRLSWIIGTLAPGQSQSVEYQVVAKKLGLLCNKLIATAAGGLREEKESCVSVGERKLGLAITGPPRRYVNLPATYLVTVSNPGTLPLTQVVINNPVPAQTTFLGASGGGQLIGNQVQWVIGTLPPAESRTVEIRLRALSPGRICNRATVTAEGGLRQQAEACTEFTGASALSLDVEHTEDPVEVGAETSYLITVRNPGTDPVTHVQIVATVPEQMMVVRAAGASDNHKEGAKITYDPLTLPAGAQAQFRIDVKAERPGDVRFKVQLTADQLTAGAVLQEESTTIFALLPMSLRKKSR